MDFVPNSNHWQCVQCPRGNPFGKYPQVIGWPKTDGLCLLWNCFTGYLDVCETSQISFKLMGTVLLFSLRTIIRSLITLQMLSNLGNKFDSFKKYQSPKSVLREAILYVDNYLPLKNPFSITCVSWNVLTTLIYSICLLDVFFILIVPGNFSLTKVLGTKRNGSCALKSVFGHSMMKVFIKIHVACYHVPRIFFLFDTKNESSWGV